ncbi:MAG: DUF3570 domain-containing protein [Candidatus Latescibacteria bacterium]|nr:DUF3570 domain-containing protein [Candidatus Latescibacterota bacterium]MCB9515667.1 DUF3570 domain-containing protein [Candidatus Latescibacterota bacterium]
MQVRRLAFVLPLLAAAPARAGLAPESQEASFLFHYFADVEDVHVRSHYAFYGLDLGGRTLNLEFNHERVSIPAVQAPVGSQEADDAITAASRPIANASDAFSDYIKVRNALQADIALGPGKLGFYRSQEVDYNASMVSGSLQRDLDHRQLNVSVGAGYGWDRVEPLSDEDTSGDARSKRIVHFNVVATRILDPKTVLRLGGELNRLSGLQHNPYRNVYAGGAREPELHPDERHRQDVFVKLNRYLGEHSSLNVDYRYYNDDWKLHSHTAGLKLNQYLGSDLVLRYRYRFYRQSGAWFWAEEYASASGIDGYRSGDYRLGPFDAHLFGTRLEWMPSALASRWRLLTRCTLRLGYERYFNTNDFAANVFETGLSLDF